MQPAITEKRLHILDLIRGFALIGLPFVNVIGLWVFRLDLAETERDILIQRFLYIFVEGRFYALFSFLFGIGFWIFLSRAKQKHDKPYLLFIRRMLILLAAGIIHQIFHPGEALLIYAIYGLIILVFFKAPKQLNLLLGIIGIIAGTVIGAKILMPLPLMLLGVAFGQYKVFESAAQHKKKWVAAAVLSFIVASAMTAILWQKAPDLGLSYIPDKELTEVQIESNMMFYEFSQQAMFAAPLFSVFYVALLVLLNQTARKWLTPLYYYGRMALTNYVGQTVLLLVVLRLYPENTMISYTAAATVCATIVIAQVIISSVWLSFFAYGPLEWLWRCGTYGKLLPIKRKAI